MQTALETSSAASMNGSPVMADISAAVSRLVSFMFPFIKTPYRGSVQRHGAFSLRVRPA